MAETRGMGTPINIHLRQNNFWQDVNADSAAVVNICPEISVNIIASTCGICNEIYSSEGIHRPQTVCKNDHIYCNNCSAKITTCPNCREPIELANVSTTDQIDRVETLKATLRRRLEFYPERALEFRGNSPDAIGAYTEVFKVTWNGQIAAMKKPRFRAKANPHLMQDILTEAAIGFHLRHPNIIRIFGIAELEHNFVGIIMEWADLGTLAQNQEMMTIDEKLKALICVCKGLSYMHQNRVAHRDLKPQNILLFGDKSVAKIADFGTSKRIQTVINCRYTIGTPKYTAPEMLKPGLRYGASVDVYSLVVIIYELLSGLEPFPGGLTEILKAKINRSAPNIPRGFPPELRSLVIQCLTQDPSQRPTIESIGRDLETVLSASSTEDQVPTEFSEVKDLTEISKPEDDLSWKCSKLPESAKTWEALTKVSEETHIINKADDQPGEHSKLLILDKPDEEEARRARQFLRRKAERTDETERQIGFGGSLFSISKKIFKNGDVYTGNWRNGQKHWWGCMDYSNGDVYNGRWKDDMKDGPGVMTYSNGDKYTGEWRDDLRHGKGFIKFSKESDLKSYDGEWRFGAMAGRGICVWKSGERFAGMWDNNQRLKGVLAYPKERDLDYFEGEWVDGKKHGVGKKVWKDGSVLDGTWCHDRLEGPGVLTFPQGSPKLRLEGDFTNEQLGFGTLLYKNGDVYEGHLKDNLCHGEGILHQIGGQIKAGIWRNDKFDRWAPVIQNFKESQGDLFLKYLYPQTSSEALPQAGEQISVQPRAKFPSSSLTMSQILIEHI